MSGSEPTIYELIGGEEALVNVVDDLYERILGDEELAGFFVGTSLPRLKGRQVEFFGEALGGPMAYTGAPMKQVHQGRGIEPGHFDLVAGHLVDSLTAAGVPEPTVGQIIAVVAPLSADIVSKPALAD
ncbi:MAG: group I truncated hemoglobin [Actinoallomurus sp.]